MLTVLRWYVAVAWMVACGMAWMVAWRQALHLLGAPTCLGSEVGPLGPPSY